MPLRSTPISSLDYNYTYIEELILHHTGKISDVTTNNIVHENLSNKNSNTKISIYFHSSTTLQIPASLVSTPTSTSTISSPFPIQINDLLEVYPFINRILIQIGSSSLLSSSTTIPWNEYLHHNYDWNSMNENDHHSSSSTLSSIFPSHVYTSPNGLSIYINYNNTMLSKTTKKNSSNNNDNPIWNQIIRSLLGKKLVCASIPTTKEEYDASSYTFYNNENKKEENEYWKLIPSSEPLTPECIHHLQSLFLPCSNKNDGLYSNVFDSFLDGNANPSVFWIDISKKEDDLENKRSGTTAIHLDIGTVYDQHIISNKDSPYNLYDLFSLKKEGTRKDKKEDSITNACPLAHRTSIHTILPSSSCDDGDNSNTCNAYNMNHTSYEYTPGSPIHLSFSIPPPVEEKQKYDGGSIRISRKLKNYNTKSSMNSYVNQGSISTIIQNSYLKDDRSMNNVTIQEFYPTNLLTPYFSAMCITWYDTVSRKEIIDRDWKDYAIYNIQKSNSITKLSITNMTLPPQTTILYTINYQPIFLPLEQIPHPPNYGIPLPPSTITYHHQNPKSTTATPTTLYSPNVLYTPPISDSSMVFNVISLTCTFYAFIIGMIFNIVLKKSSESMKRKVVSDKNKKEEDGKKQVLLNFFHRLQFWKNREGVVVIDDKAIAADDKKEK